MEKQNNLPGRTKKNESYAGFWVCTTEVPEAQEMGVYMGCKQEAWLKHLNSLNNPLAKSSFFHLANVTASYLLLPQIRGYLAKSWLSVSSLLGDIRHNWGWEEHVEDGAYMAV